LGLRNEVHGLATPSTHERRVERLPKLKSASANTETGLNPGVGKTIAWLLAYMALALAPMLIALGGERPAPRGLLVEIGAMLGLLGLGVLAMQLVLSGRHRWFGLGFGQDNLLQFHRQTGQFAWLLVLAHPLTLILGDQAFMAYLDPRDDLLRALALIFVLLAVTTLVVSSLWRLALGLSYEVWRTLHATLSLLVVAIGLGHALLVDHYSAGLGTKLALALLIAIPLLLLLESRLLRPWRLRQRPWRLIERESRPDDVIRLVLEAEGHSGMRFRPGQYAWLTLGDSPFSLQQHPFSMTSLASRPDRIEFFIKQSGDFTRSLSTVEIGSRAWLEGPYGVFTMVPSAARRTVFIAGGIGITPIVGMLRCCADLGCSQPMWLIYANNAKADINLGEEIAALSERLSLQVIHVLNEPPDDWQGETGYIDADLLARTLPADSEDTDYFVCGPQPMMDSVEPALRQRGASVRRIHSERFDLV
jgi:predicted ferric reductase